MRVVETCKCGAKIEVYWDGEGRYQREREPERSRKELENFRRRHKPCLGPPTVVYQQQPETAIAPLARPVNVC